MCLAALFADSRINEGAMIISIKSSFTDFSLFCCGFTVHPSLLVSGEKRGKMRSKPAFRYQMKLIKVFFAS